MDHTQTEKVGASITGAAHDREREDDRTSPALDEGKRLLCSHTLALADGQALPYSQVRENGRRSDVYPALACRDDCFYPRGHVMTRREFAAGLPRSTRTIPCHFCGLSPALAVRNCLTEAFVRFVTQWLFSLFFGHRWIGNWSAC